MSIVSFIKKYNKIQSQYMKDFDLINLELSMTRLNILNAAMFLICIYLFYNDFSTLTSVNNRDYRDTLFIIHLFIFGISLISLILIQIIRKYNSENWIKTKWGFVHIYISLSIMIGISVSLNSV